MTRRNWPREARVEIALLDRQLSETEGALEASERALRSARATIAHLQATVPGVRASTLWSAQRARCRNRERCSRGTGSCDARCVRRFSGTANACNPVHTETAGCPTGASGTQPEHQGRASLRRRNQDVTGRPAALLHVRPTVRAEYETHITHSWPKCARLGPRTR